MDKKEKELAEAENQRIRKLMLEGVIPMENGKHNKGNHKKKSSHRNKAKHSNNEVLKTNYLVIDQCIIAIRSVQFFRFQLFSITIKDS